jgi:hypothetical protein
MKSPAARLHRPVKALRRLQDLTGDARNVAANDRNENRAAQLDSILREAFDICVAALSGGPLPEPIDHSKAV